MFGLASRQPFLIYPYLLQGQSIRGEPLSFGTVVEDALPWQNVIFIPLIFGGQSIRCDRRSYISNPANALPLRFSNGSLLEDYLTFSILWIAESVALAGQSQYASKRAGSSASLKNGKDITKFGNML